MAHLRQLTIQHALALLAIWSAAACGSDAPAAPVPRVLTTVNVSLAAPSMEVGQFSDASAAGLDQNGAPIAIGSISWSSAQPTVAAISPTTGAILAIAPGTTAISATVDGKVGTGTVTVSRAPSIRINEVESFGDDVTGFIELFNPTAEDVDLSGWTLHDDNLFGPSFTFPAGTIILAGAYKVINEANVPFSIAGTGASYLFSRFGVLVDGATWAVVPPSTAGRCPNGAGPLVTLSVITRGGPNICP